ncbi:MAG: hypothetical protein MSA89_12810 [Clostridium sp.]|nr:hypothetical protein [Clostridium sp.]
MKSKKIITVLATIAVVSTLIVSCGKSENDKNKTVNSTDTAISTDTATSNNSEEDSKGESSETSTSTEGGEVITANSDEELKFEEVDIPENLIKDNSVDNMNYLSEKIDTNISIDELQASLFDLVGQSGVTNREVLLKNENQADGDTLVVLFSEKDNKNIKLYNVNEEKLNSVNGNFDSYVKECLEGTESVDILDNLTSTQIVGIRCKAATTPCQIITWEDENGELKYLAIK